MSDAEVRSHTDAPVDWRRMAELMRRMLVTLDGLWFVNALEALGPEKTMEMDIRVFTTQFRTATRRVREIMGHDGRSVDDKVAVFQAMAHLYGHRFEVLVDGDSVTMRLKQCAFYENLKKAGRLDEHDCRILCRAIARPWFEEIEPRTGGEGSVDLQLPTGGPHCDWTVRHPRDV